MEKILQQILENVANLSENVANLSEGQAQIVSRLESIDSRLDNMGNRLDSMDNRLERIEDTVNKIEAGQQKDVIAMLERTATKNDIATLSASIDVLNSRTFQQETKLRLIENTK